MSASRRPRPRRTPPVAPPRAITVTATAATALSWAIIAVVLWSIYRDVAFVVLAAVAIPLGIGIALTGVLLRWPSIGMLAAAVAATLVVGVPLAVPGRTVYGVLPEPGGLLDLVAGVALGWRQLITIDLPVGAYQALLVPALVLLLGGPLATLALALRLKRGELAALVPLAGFLLAIALGPETAALPISTTIALATTLLLWQAVWRRHRRAAAVGDAGRADAGRTGARALAAATTLLLVAGAAGAALVAVVPPPGDRTVLRSLVDPPFDPLAQPSPLGAYRASFATEVADLTAVVIAGAPEGSRLRVAALDSYDGTVFAVGSDRVDSPSGSFVRIPTRRDLAAVPGDRVRVEIELRRPSGVWLPTVGELESIAFSGESAADLRDRFVLNATTGTAAFVGGPPTGVRYTVDAVIPTNPATPLSRAVPGAEAVPAITAVPDALREWLDGVTAGIEGEGARLERALTSLREQGYLSHGIAEDEAPSRSGHSLDRLDELFSAPLMIGDAEQFAAAGALLARELGFPSRVIIGFGPLPGAATTTLLESDRTAWVEVATAEGWVAVDVAPQRRELPPTEPDDPVPVSRPQNAVQPPVDDAPPLEELAPPEIEARDDTGLDPFWQAVLAVLRVLGVVLLVAALLAAPFLGIVAAKLHRRRRRRTAADPALRILGGWHDVTDQARDYGVELPVAATRTEAAQAIGRPSALVLARVTDRAVYAPEPPSEHEAERVWEAADALRASLAEGRNRRERWRAAVSMTSLRRYPGRGRTTGGRRR
ncbi:transglutaminaseTgpA domain-containing protein [Microcella frigidaquae]|uniref:Transglutaminase-like domain-containing protein n=1 Tax=Microcella frigidaquae TaxID=424758 RepID=A0A840XSE9_9MICO|nr:hypothetical protein [Microcella frigidaquae]NHN44959.1 transglutaminase domain-containing protein [Microcella frigidaquae]